MHGFSRAQLGEAQAFPDVMDQKTLRPYFKRQEFALMCTSLLYRDAANRTYLGRTMELSIELPYQVAHFPKGLHLSSAVPEQAPLNWQTRHAIVAVTMPTVLDVPSDQHSLKIVEGMNDAGLTFSLQSYSQANGPQDPVPEGKATLAVQDLGTWVLGQFSTVHEIKAALAEISIRITPVPLLGGQGMPFHYGVRDTTGAGLVIEFHEGKLSVHDNPVGVMTNGPQFDWHLINLNNYTFISNIDRSTATFGSFKARQPDPGISKTGLPSSDTAVDRFIRAVYYTQFAEKQPDPDKAVQMVAHIMNNFDRPRGISILLPEDGAESLQVAGQTNPSVSTEFTTWTSVSDMNRHLFFLRNSRSMNYICLDLAGMAETAEFRAVPIEKLTSAYPVPRVQIAAE